jgi:hypothetical protein
MKKLALTLLVVLPVAAATPASASPAMARDGLMSAAIDSAPIEVKGGRGGGHGFGRGGGGRAWGWSRGRKVGWRGRGCPPGLWRQGRC